MIVGCSTVLAWLSSFIGRLLRVAPLQVVASILASLCSQLFQIAAFLLPLKVMILLGSPGVPSYFPRFLAGIERERLILLLAGVAVLLYLMHLLMDYIGATLARVGSELLILQPQEGEGLARQRKIAQSLYQGVITAASGTVFALGVLSFLGIFNTSLLMVVLGYFLAVFLIGSLVLGCWPALLDKVVMQFRRVIDVLSACGFLLVFGVLVAGFLYGDAKGLLLGILTLLLCRQMFSRLAMTLKSVERLYGHRERALKALGGLHMGELDDELSGDLLERADEPLGLIDGGSGALISDRNRPRHPPFWNMVVPERCSAWIRESLAAVGANGSETRITQLDTGRPGELALHLACTGEGRSAEHFLFKAFNRKEAKRVDRAAAMLALYPGEATVRLRAVIERDGFASHLYQWAEQAPLQDDIQAVYVCREQAFIDSCGWPVPEVLLDDRLSKNLAERCSPRLWGRCQAFSRWQDTDTRQLVGAFAAAPLRLQRALEQLPLRLHNPDITLGNIYLLGGTPKALRWENWTLEPVGSGWPLELGLERLDQVFARIRESSEDLRSLSTLQVRLAALAFAFEECCARWAYLDAFALLGELRDTLDALDR